MVLALAQSSLTGIVTAISAVSILLVSLTGLIVAFGRVFPNITNRIDAAHEAVDEVHTLVNDHSTKQDARIEQLVREVSHLGGDIPPTPGQEPQ